MNREYNNDKRKKINKEIKKKEKRKTNHMDGISFFY